MSVTEHTPSTTLIYSWFSFRCTRAPLIPPPVGWCEKPRGQSVNSALLQCSVDSEKEKMTGPKFCCFLFGERKPFSIHFCFTHQAKLSCPPFFCLAAFAFHPSVFLSFLPSFSGRDALRNTTLPPWPVVKPAWWNVLQTGAKKAQSRTEVYLSRFISVFCVSLSISPQLPESGQFLMSRHQ